MSYMSSLYIQSSERRQPLDRWSKKKQYSPPEMLWSKSITPQKKDIFVSCKVTQNCNQI